jgi:hypothetical protein
MTCEYISRISLAFETQPHEPEQPDEPGQPEEPEKENIFLAMGFPFTLCGNGMTETTEELAAELPMEMYGNL